MKSIVIMSMFVTMSASLFAQAKLQVRTDAVKVASGELIIENNTRDSAGVLVNKGGGQTEFRRLHLLNIGDSAIAIEGQDTLRFKGSAAGAGKSVQFKTGISPGYPVEGDSIFISSHLIGKNVKVWRNGEFQYRDPEDGIEVDSTLGKIIFRPVLLQDDRVYIEAVSGLSLEYEPIPRRGLPLVYLEDAVVNLPVSSVQLNSQVIENGAVISAYEWTQVSGPGGAVIASPGSVSTAINNLSNGVFVFRLRVITSTGIQVTDNATVTVFPDNGGLKTMRVYFSHTPAPAVPGWFNVYGPVTNNHIVKTDPVTSWTVDNVGTGPAYWAGFGFHNSSDTAGTTTGSNSGIVPDIVLKGFWFNFSVAYSTNDNLWITGLNPAKTYTLKMVAARSAGATPPAYGSWHINGGAAVTLNAHLNTSNQAIINNVVPDAGGKIRIAVYRNPDGVAYGALSFLNALIVQEE